MCIDSVRGDRGGYRLARPARGITVKDVIEGAEERTFEVNRDVHPVGGS